MKERQVEKLTPDMVGMEVSVDNGNNWLGIKFVGDKIAVLNAECESWTYVRGDYIVRDPKEKEKLPSERLTPLWEVPGNTFRDGYFAILDEHHKRLLELEARK